MKRLMTTYKLVKITWEDACSDDGVWVCSEHNPLKPLMMVSVGILLKRDRRHFYTLGLSMSKNGNLSQRISIPKGCVTSIETLGKVEF